MPACVLLDVLKYSFFFVIYPQRNRNNSREVSGWKVNEGGRFCFALLCLNEILFLLRFIFENSLITPYCTVHMSHGKDGLTQMKAKSKKWKFHLLFHHFM